MDAGNVCVVDSLATNPAAEREASEEKSIRIVVPVVVMAGGVTHPFKNVYGPAIPS